MRDLSQMHINCPFNLCSPVAFFFWIKQELAGLVYMHTRLGCGCHQDNKLILQCLLTGFEELNNLTWNPPRFSGVMTFAIRPSNNENRKCTSLEFQENEITLSSQTTSYWTFLKMRDQMRSTATVWIGNLFHEVPWKNGLTVSITQHSSKCETKWKLHPFVVVSSFQPELNLYKLQTIDFVFLWKCSG